MTNGEKLKAVLNPRANQIRILGNWVEIEIQKLGINFSCGLDWWNTEYKEPTTKNDLGVDCIDRAEVLKLMQDNWHTHNGDWAMQESMDDIRALPSVTPQEPRIITCKDCKYYRNKGNKRSYCTKRLNIDSVTDRYREPNFYCADAVLREVEKRQEKKHLIG